MAASLAATTGRRPRLTLMRPQHFVPATLRVIHDHVVVTERTLEATLAIGRSPDNDLVLDDTQVSGHHGRLQPLDDAASGGARWRYTDLGSTNGTTVAGGAVLRKGESVLLREDTQLLLGNTVLDLRLGDAATDDDGDTTEGAAAQQAAGSYGTTVAPARPAAPASHASAAPDAGAPRGGAPDRGGVRTGLAPAGRPRMVVVIGSHATVVPIPGSSAVLGRGAGCDVRIDDPSVSALQARLSYADGRWMLTDLSATNPTRLGLRRVVDAEPVADGAHLIAGAADLLFVCDDTTVPADAQRALDVRALQLAQRDQRLTAAQVRQAEAALAAGGVRLGEFLVSSGWLSPGAWVELLTEAHAPETARDVHSASKRRRRIVAALVVAAALALAAWLAASALA